MRKSLIVLVFGFMITAAEAQKSLSRKEWKMYDQIYSAALDNLIDSPSHFILIDSTSNSGIQNFRFSDFVNEYRLVGGVGFDSIWLSFLQHADEKKSRLIKIKLNTIRSAHSIILLNNDSLFTIHAKKEQVGSKIEPYGWVDGSVTISTPLMSKDKTKAVVDIAYTTGIRSGFGGIISLKKRNDGKWVVNQFMSMWIADPVEQE